VTLILEHGGRLMMVLFVDEGARGAEVLLADCRLPLPALTGFIERVSRVRPTSSTQGGHTNSCG